MMVNCPKCGFSQPQDQYCAQCGIDMLAFKPAETPLLKRVLGSMVFQAVGLVVVVATVLGVVRHQRHQAMAEHLAERIAEIENAKNTEIVSRKTAETLAGTSKTESASTTPPPDAPLNDANLNPNEAAAASAGSVTNVNAPPPAASPGLAPGLVGDTTPAALGAAAGTGATAAGAAAKPASNLRVVFAEVQKVMISDLVASSDTRYPVSTSGPVFYGVIPNLQTKLRAAQADGRMKIVDSNSRSIEQGQPASLNSGQRDEASGQMLGFDVEAVASQLTDAESHFQLRVLRYLRDVSGQAEEFSIPLPDSMVIPKGAGAFIAGVLPRRIVEADRRFYDPFKVLHILSTEDYRTGVTDLVILIEPR